MARDPGGDRHQHYQLDRGGGRFEALSWHDRPHGTSAIAKLKVFEARLGFHDSVVAVPSQAAALRAWDVRQNLFAEGLARPASDPAAITAALAHPGEPLRRPAGSAAPFELDPKGVPPAPKPVIHRPAGRGGAVAPSGGGAPRSAPKPADRSRLDAAEAKLRKSDEAWRREEMRLRQRREALDRDEAEALSRHEAACEDAQRRLAKARADYERARNG